MTPSLPSPETEADLQRNVVRLGWVCFGLMVIFVGVSWTWIGSLWLVVAFTTLGLVSLSAIWLAHHRRQRLGAMVLLAGTALVGSSLPFIDAGMGLNQGVGVFVFFGAMGLITLPVRHYPRVLSFGVALAVLIILIDLYGPADRQLPSPTTIPLRYGLVVLSSIAYAILLARRFRYFPLTAKINIILLSLTLLTTAGVVAVLNQILQTELEETLAHNFQTLGESKAQQISGVLVQNITSLRALALDARLVEQARASVPFSATVLTQRAQQWATADALNNDADPLVATVLHNPAADTLRAFQTVAPQSLVMFVTDASGVLLAATARPPNYLHATADWWQAALTQGVYIGSPEYDPNQKQYVAVFAVVLRSAPEAPPQGVLRATFNVGLLGQIISEASRTAEVDLRFPGDVILKGNRESQATGLHPLLPGEIATLAVPLSTLTEGLYQRRLDKLMQMSVTTLEPGLKDLIAQLNWFVILHQDRLVALSPVMVTLRFTVLTALIALLVATVAGAFLARFLAQPLVRLANTAEQITQGDLQARARVDTADEVGLLAQTFNAMTTRLSDLISTLEQRVQDRTRTLEQARQELERRANQLAVAAEVARTTTSILTVNELLGEAASLIAKQFNLYFVGVFLIDPTGQWVVLRAGTGEAGRALLELQYKLPLNDQSMIGACIQTGHARLSLAIAEDTQRVSHPLLPNTQSEMALPLRSQGRVLGGMTIQAAEPNAFSEADILTLTTMADQLSNAIQNARLVRDMRRSQAEIERLLAEAEHRAQELARAKETADAASNAKSEFLAKMSHELRTPLSGILGYTQILRRHKNLTSEQLEALGVVQSSGEHLLMLINDILDLAKIEAQRLELLPTPVSLVPFLQGVVNLIRTRADQKDLTFRYEALTTLPPGLIVDEKRLRQVLLNLLGNAIKFTMSGLVELRVSVINAHGAPVAYQPGEAQCRLRFEVQDTGPGLSPEAQARLFRSFEQVGTQQQRAEGAGLGLAISQQLVRLMESHIQVRSVLDEGSTFWFDVTLPVTEAELDPQHGRYQLINGYRGPRQKILVVDDKDYNRAVLANLLRPLGFDVLEAEDGHRGVELARAEQPVLIFMDLVMPVLMGYEATARIRQDPTLREVVIIAASASAFDDDKRQALSAGCDGFIAKPINVPDLFALLEKHLHLQWEYETPTAKPSETVTEAVNVTLPPEIVSVLYDLALSGDMTRLKEQADQLEAQSEAYRPFAIKLRLLAKNYESEAIVALIEGHLPQS